ncbi:MAG: hypothetical protein VX738_12445, partial [Planctomycetota bacterium]|nr:hypothetical protein [Planctomycetota bacterium]
MANYIRRRQQRGVILLAIISLLTMFMLIGITYVVVSGHFKRAAITNSQARQLGVPPQKHLDGAMYQLLRDTDLAGSAARGHGLLQDKYGHFTLHARVVRATMLADIQILEIHVHLADLPLPITGGAAPPNLAAMPLLNLGALNGRVITFRNGRAQNVSGRILKSAPRPYDTAANYTLRLLVPKAINEFFNNDATMFHNNHVLINGRDFSGTGFGLEIRPARPRYGQLTANALLPNRAADTIGQFNGFRQGGANEGYDVPDYQNMALAGQLSNPATRQLQYVIPSFHRPALINYWIRNRSVLATMPWRQKLGHILMRPMPWDHPNFTGGNSNMTLPSILADGYPGTAGMDDDGNGIIDFTDTNGDGIMQADEMDIEEIFFPGSNDNLAAIIPGGGNFPWDVDNDGDGIRDSVWIDMGFPIQTDSSGRQYKPLFALLCMDMDGRLNLNAHGNQMHYLANATNPTVPLAGGGNSLGFPRGMGYGPAEINLNVLFGTPVEYQQLLMGIAGQTPGRYQWDRSPGKSGIDNFSYYIFGHFPRNFVDFRYTSFQSMPDIHGELAYGINRSGNLVYEVSTVPATSDLAKYPTAGGRRHTIVDNPYETNLVIPNSTDQLFTAHEMEALLRSQDPDNPRSMTTGADGRWGVAGTDDDGNGIVDDISEAGTLISDDVINRDGSSRLYRLTNTFNGNSNSASANRRSVTTASFDPPVPAVQIRDRLRSGQTRYNMGSHASQLLRARMLQDGDVRMMVGAYARPELQEIALNNLMSWTRGADGQWGEAGTDDDGNGTVDDIFDAGWSGSDDVRSPLLAIKIFDGLRMDVNRPFGNGIDDNGDGVVDNPFESYSRERLWQDVFVDANPVWFDHDNDGRSTVADPNAYLARHHYARNLYVLMLLMNDRPLIDFNRNGRGDEDFSGDNNADEKEFNLAQWAANAVDFRDADSIMTPFEFDLNPFNGWDVDGDLNTVEATAERGLVWGSERPELLITE